MFIEWLDPEKSQMLVKFGPAHRADNLARPLNHVAKANGSTLCQASCFVRLLCRARNEGRGTSSVFFR